MAPRPLRVLTVDLPPGSILPPSLSMPKSPLMQPGMQPGFPSSPGLGVYSNQPSPRYNQPSPRYNQPASYLNDQTGGFSQPGSPFGRSHYSTPSPFLPASPALNPSTSNMGAMLDNLPPQKRTELLKMILSFLEKSDNGGGFGSMPPQHQLYEGAHVPRTVKQQQQPFRQQYGPGQPFRNNSNSIQMRSRGNDEEPGCCVIS